jgi:DNA-binding transcriptional LysR family regulator
LDRDVLSGVAVFVAVTEVGSFTAAADQLGLTKASVGRTIARLEQRLGFKLFHRNRRITSLTEQGEAYLAACASAIEEVAAAQVALSSNHKTFGGRLHVDLPGALGRRLILPTLLEIGQAHSGLSLTVSFSDPASDVGHEQADLTLRLGRVEEGEDRVSRHLMSFKRVICASPAYLRNHGEPKTVTELRGHRCIVGLSRSPLASWFIAEGDTERRFTPPSVHRLGDGEAMVEAAVAGLGIAQMLQLQAQAHLAAKSLKSILRSSAMLDVDLHATWPRRRQLDPALRHVVDQLAAHADAGRLSGRLGPDGA